MNYKLAEPITKKLMIYKSHPSNNKSFFLALTLGFLFSFWDFLFCMRRANLDHKWELGHVWAVGGRAGGRAVNVHEVDFTLRVA